MPTWTFIRHGQSTANAESWFAGQVDVPLTALGVEQARQARQTLEVTAWTRAFSSDLIRAHHTATLVLEGTDLHVTTTPALRERSCGRWDRTAIDFGAEKLALLRRWDFAPPGGESLQMVAYRTLTWLSSQDTHDGHTVVFAHGALMRALIGQLDEIPLQAFGQWKPKNLEAVTRDVPHSRWHDLATKILASSIAEPR